MYETKKAKKNANLVANLIIEHKSHWARSFLLLVVLKLPLCVRASFQVKDGGHVHVLAAEELHAAESAQEAAGGLGGGAPEAEEADAIGPSRPLGGLGQLRE